MAWLAKQYLGIPAPYTLHIFSSGTFQPPPGYNGRKLIQYKDGNT